MSLPGRLYHWFAQGRWRRAGGVLLLAGQGFFYDDGSSWAAAIAYYSLLSLLPLFLAAGSVAAYFVDPSWVVHQATRYLGELLPGGPGAIERIVMQTLAAGRGKGLFFIVPMLWTGSLVFNAVTRALNVAAEEEEDYGFWRRTGVRLLMLLTLGGMFLTALVSTSLLRVLHANLGFLGRGRGFLFGLLLAVLPVAFVLLSFFLAYRFVPRRKPAWRAALAGALVATLLFAAAKPLFLGYVQKMARYNVIYGSMAGMIVIVLWLWVVAMIGIFGGQVASHTQAIFIERRPLEDAARRYLRRPRPS